MGVPLMIIGGALGAASSVYQGEQQARAYKAQAAVAESNRRTSERLASEALSEGAREEKQFKRQARQFAASQEAALAGSGTQMSGSALNVLADTAMGIEEDAAMIRYNTLKNKWGYDVQATNFANEARSMRSAARGARTAGLFGAATSILSAGTNIWAAGQQNLTAKNGAIKVDNPGGFGLGGTANYVPPDSISGYSYDWWKHSRQTVRKPKL